MIRTTRWPQTFALAILALAFASPLHAQRGAGATAETSNASESAIRVTLLGTGRPDPAIDRFGPSTLVQAGGETLLFDCGRGASQRLWQLGIPLSRVGAVFLTHLHSDHTVGLPELWLTGCLPTPFGGRTTPLAVWGPKAPSDDRALSRRRLELDRPPGRGVFGPGRFIYEEPGLCSTGGGPGDIPLQPGVFHPGSFR